MISYEEILIYMYQQLITGLIDLSNRYLIIDEYQDCIMMQQKIVTYLLKSKKIRGLYLIGDINQSIFDYDNTISSWLDTLINIKIGSKKSNLLDVLKLESDTNETYDKIQLMNLSVNYRSTREIVKLANSLTKNDQMESNYTYDKEKYRQQQLK
jgi:ATP-dependent exoDNAse (exonuclease V) beta subunit